MNWKNMFKQHILHRGYDYFCDGAVENITIEDNVIKATVCGTDDYEVEIIFKGEEISDMYCSCPYAESGENCKHMAAVLFEWEDNNNLSKGQRAENISTSAGNGSNNEVDNIIAQADEATIKKFLTAILKDDEKLYARFKTIVSPELSKDDMNRYIRQVDTVVHKYLGREHFIKYREATYFVNEMEEFLQEDVQRMLDNECYLNAFELTNYIFVTVANVDMDDSDGGTGILANSCNDIWVYILENSDDKVKQTMFDWFISHLNGSIIDYMEDYIKAIIMEQFTENKYLEAMLGFSEQRVKASKLNDDSWSESYNGSQWALKHIFLMQDLGKDWIEIERYCKENWKYSEIRKYYINECIKQQDYETAIEVLKDSLQIDSDFAGLVRGFSWMLKDCYYTCGKEDEYKNQLWQLMTKDDAGNIEIYNELKAQYRHEEWIEVRESIFRKLPSYAHVERLYKVEGLYDKLLEYVIKSPGLYALMEYVEDLKNKYPVEILQKYSDEVNKMARHTGHRNRYKELVSILRIMVTMENGKEIVSEITRQWRIAYGNRPAMMDELSRL